MNLRSWGHPALRFMHPTARSLRIRVALAVLVGGVSIVVIGCAWTRGPANGSSGSAAIAADAAGADDRGAERGWISVANADAASAAARIAGEAKERWLAKGMAPEKAGQLGDDVSTVLTAIFAPDFDVYHRHMAARGLSLDEIASGFASAMLEWEIYPASVPELAPDRTVEEKIRYLWDHPRERDAAFESVRPSSLMVGFGLMAESNTPEWPYAGHYAQLSLYAPKGGRLMEEEGTRTSRSKDSAWIMFEGRFRGGMRTRVKVHFYFDEAAGVWIPVTVVFGTDGAHRPFPML